MNKKCIFVVILLAGIVSIASATDQFFFELNGGVWFYPGFGGKAGWIHYWNNEKIGLIGDIIYFNNGFVNEPEGYWKEEVKKAHNFGIAAGVFFNNMGMNGIFRTSEYVKLKGVLSIWDKPKFLPYLDVGFKLNVFFTDKTAFSAGIGLDMATFIYPYSYISLGMTFTL